MMAYQYKGYWSPADTVKERILLDERFNRSDCPWMVSGPGAIGAAGSEIRSVCKCRSRPDARPPFAPVEW